jgi:hypothetical protein
LSLSLSVWSSCHTNWKQNGTYRLWDSQMVTRMWLGKEQIMLIKEEISSHNQKTFPNIAETNDECKNWSRKKTTTTTTTKLQSRLLNYAIIPCWQQHGKLWPSFYNLPLTNLNVNVFKALGSSTIFCKLAATVKHKHGEIVSILFPITLDFHINDSVNLTNDAINCKIISFTHIRKSI